MATGTAELDLGEGARVPALLRARMWAVAAAARARGWRLHTAAPGLAGAALLSVAAGLVFLPAGLAVAGLFCLRLDSRL
jgi:hypothetical protein